MADEQLNLVLAHTAHDVFELFRELSGQQQRVHAMLQQLLAPCGTAAAAAAAAGMDRVQHEVAAVGRLPLLDVLAPAALSPDAAWEPGEAVVLRRASMQANNSSLHRTRGLTPPQNTHTHTHTILHGQPARCLNRCNQQQQPSPAAHHARPPAAGSAAAAHYRPAHNGRQGSSGSGGGNSLGPRRRGGRARAAVSSSGPRCGIRAGWQGWRRQQQQQPGGCCCCHGPEGGCHTGCSRDSTLPCSTADGRRR
jgi:hypothetical protein